MTWNYRLVRHPGNANTEDYYCIHEVYYDQEGKAIAMTLESVGIGGSSIAEILEDAQHYMAALLKEPIDYIGDNNG